MRGRYDERDIEFLRGCTETIVCELFGLSRPDQPFKCPSPDHDDRTPSARFYVKDGLIHCYGCDKTWDVFSVVGMVFGITGYRGQIEKVAELVGFRLGESGASQGPKTRAMRRQRPPFDPPREAGGADCYEACGRAFGDLYAPGNEVGREYLRTRGLDDDDAARFGLGFTRDPKSIMPEFGVFEKGSPGFITIPFWNRDFTAANYCMLRTIPGDGEVRCKEWRPKGLASPLYNEWMLSASLPVVFVTEGLIDAMALSKMIEQPVMALGGVSNAKRLASILYYTQPDMRPRSVVVCMDEDDEGHKARDRIMADLAKMNVAHAAFGPYPRCAKDPDAWLTSGQGIDWDYVLRQGPAGIDPLYATEWCDGR